MTNPNGNVANLKHLPAGPDHPRWNDKKMISREGYVKLRVGRGHPLADPNGYAYEHLIIWVSAGNPRPPVGWLLHHKNEIKTDNRLSNLELKEKDRHGVDHASPFSDADVVAMREAYGRGEADTTQLAEQYGVGPQTIWKIIRGLRRKNAGGPIQSGSLRGHGRPRIGRQA